MLIQSRTFVDSDEKIARVRHELNYHSLMVEKTERELKRLIQQARKDLAEYDSKFESPVDLGD